MRQKTQSLVSNNCFPCRTKLLLVIRGQVVSHDYDRQRKEMRLGIICLDSTGAVQVWNRDAMRLLGWNLADVVGRLLPVELRVLLTLTPDKSRSTIVSLGTKGKGNIDVRAQTALWRNADGCEGTLIALQETSDAPLEENLLNATAQAEAAHEEARAARRFRDLLEAAPDAIIEADADGRIVLLNRGAERMFGYMREELLGANVEILVPESARARHTHHRETYKAHPATRPMGIGLTLEGRKKDGSRFPLEISLSPVESEEGFRVTAILRDVSERKQAEDALRAVQEKYTQELADRNRELERANRLKSEFLASMSHELRTPLHTVIGFSELLGEELQGPLNEKQKRFVNHIHKDSLHLLELINDVLDLSKIESGRLNLRLETFDFQTVLEESLGSIRPQAQAKSQIVETEVVAPLTLEADRLRIKQVLVNLLSNAVKFTPEGGSIRVAVREQGHHAVVSISDTGIGIPKSEHESIFDKFYQVSATTKGVREGTGLGLAITKHLVEEHGGHMSLESEPGKGAVFTFWIPLRTYTNGSVGE
jgi:PAS domain S-box-containing protein